MTDQSTKSTNGHVETNGALPDGALPDGQVLTKTIVRDKEGRLLGIAEADVMPRAEVAALMWDHEMSMLRAVETSMNKDFAEHLQEVANKMYSMGFDAGFEQAAKLVYAEQDAGIPET